MKYLIILLLFIIPSVSFSQGKQAEDSTKVTFSKVYNDAKGALEGLAASLKTGASHVYEVLVRQQIVNSVVWLVLFLMSIACIYPAWKIMKAAIRHDNDTYDAYAVPAGIFCLIIGGFIITCVYHIDTIITGFINPEYGALYKILETINGK